MLKWALSGLAALVLVILGAILVTLITHSTPAFGVNLVFGNDFDVASNTYRGLPLLVGTLVTSAVALILGVPVAVAGALYLTELCPVRLRAPLGALVDLLAAVPSVVYGLWGFFILAPTLVPAEKWLADTFSFLPWIGGGAAADTGLNYVVAGLILAIMIVPIVSATSREVLAAVPPRRREAALALGATRWETIVLAVLAPSRSGIIGGALLGLARALGETIAVVLVIGDDPDLGHHLLSQGYTLASVIANQFGEAAGLHRSALFAVGLVLFVLTVPVSVLARLAAGRGELGRRA